MVILPFSLEGQTLKKGRDFPQVVEKSNKYLNMNVNGIPSGYTATAYFRPSWENEKTYNKVMENGQCVVDEYLTTLPENASDYQDYKLGISIACVNGDGVRLTTNVVEISIDKTAYDGETENTPELPRSQFDELVEIFQQTGGGGGASAEGAVLYTPQELTEEQKVQARANIDTAKFEKDTAAFTPPNVLAGMSLTYTEGTSWGSGGNIANNQYTKNYAALLPMIDVLSGQTYRIPNYSGVVMLYDENGTNGTQVALPSGDFEFTVPEGKAKAGIAFLFNNISAPTEMYRETMTDEEYDALPLKNDNLSITPENIKSTAAVSLLAPLKGKTIVNFGDSIFGNARPPLDISTRLAELTGATVHNCGFGGCRMAQHASDNFDAFSMYRLADAIAAGDFSAQEFALTNTASDKVPDYFAETVALLKSIDFGKVDIITIAYGTNDWNGGYNKGGDYILGEPQARPLDTNYVSGALRYSIETILTAHPHIRIVICSPTYRFFLDASNNFVEDSDTKVVATHTLADCIAQEREIAEEYKLTFVDNYHIGINKVNRGYYFPANDGAHHEITGRKLIAEHIAKCLY